MRAPKLMAFITTGVLVTFISCKSTADLERENIYSGIITMSNGQEVPASPVSSSATGTIDASYNKLTKTLTYKISFSGLTGNATAAHIHGIAESGVTTGVVQSFSGFPAATAGTYSGSLYFDGVKLIESELIDRRYYVNIHTASNPGGEIRGQLILTRK